MRLSRRKIQGRHYDAPLKGEPLDEQQKPALLAKVRAGNQEACDRLISGHITLAIHIVGRYINVLGTDKDADFMFSSALEGICTAVHRIKKGVMKHENVTGYITDCIHSAISDELDRLHFIRIPERTRNLHKHKIPDFERHNLQEYEVYTYDALEVEETKEKLIESDRDREILNYRLAGHSDPEIATMLGVSRQTVNLYRREMQKRYNDE